MSRARLTASLLRNARGVSADVVLCDGAGGSPGRTGRGRPIPPRRRPIGPDGRRRARDRSGQSDAGEGSQRSVTRWLQVR